MDHVWFDEVIKTAINQLSAQDLQLIKEHFDETCNKIYPNINKMWSWTWYCKPEDVKVVILGQDPYHTPGMADGLAFSTKNGVVPPSLRNIFNEIKRSMNIECTTSNLSCWAKQGVLLLNVVPLVYESKPKSHYQLGWEKITESILKTLSDKYGKIVFMLWGREAQAFQKCIDEKNNVILKACHPSPLARNFVGSNIFVECNTYLTKLGLQPIDWSTTSSSDDIKIVNKGLAKDNNYGLKRKFIASLIHSIFH